MSAHLRLKTAVILINLGTPQAPTAMAVARYLNQFLSDPRVVELPAYLWQPLLKGLVLPLRSRASAKLYRSIWSEQGSPLQVHSQQLSQRLSARFADQPIDVFLAMRYGEPSLHLLLDQLAQQNYKKWVVVPMYPQYASATTGSSLEVVYRALSQQRNQPSVATLHSYHDHPAYIEALAQSVRHSWQTHGRGQHLVISFHGIPERSWRLGDPYACLCQKTGRLLAEALGLEAEAYRVVFQSRFGKAKWLQPYCLDSLQNLAQTGTKTIDVICPGFAVDCLETLEEMAIRNQDFFQQAGGERLQYIPCLNASDAQVDLYYSLIQPYLG